MERIPTPNIWTFEKRIAPAADGLPAVGMTRPPLLARRKSLDGATRKRRAEPFLRMIGALQRSSQEKFGSSQLIGRGCGKSVSRDCAAERKAEQRSLVGARSRRASVGMTAPLNMWRSFRSEQVKSRATHRCHFVVFEPTTHKNPKVVTLTVRNPGHGSLAARLSGVARSDLFGGPGGFAVAAVGAAGAAI